MTLATETGGITRTLSKEKSMFENKAFYIEVIEKTASDQNNTAKPAKDEVKELITYTVKAVAALIVVGGIVATTSELLVHHLS
jgi:hypothetical protein